MTKDDGIRPSEDGTAVAKDTWLAAIGLALMFTTGDKKEEEQEEQEVVDGGIVIDEGAVGQ